jgi:hypothetical protein
MCASRSVLTPFVLLSALSAAVFVSSASAQSCKPDVPWQHEHVAGKGEQVVTTDVTGSRATRLEICRTDVGTAKGVDVELRFEGSHGERPLAAGECAQKFAKWAVVRSHVAKDATDVGPVAGVYRVCREK